MKIVPLAFQWNLVVWDHTVWKQLQVVHIWHNKIRTVDDLGGHKQKTWKKWMLFARTQELLRKKEYTCAWVSETEE
jgi:hypothetical protein